MYTVYILCVRVCVNIHLSTLSPFLPLQLQVLLLSFTPSSPSSFSPYSSRPSPTPDPLSPPQSSLRQWTSWAWHGERPVREEGSPSGSWWGRRRPPPRDARLTPSLPPLRSRARGWGPAPCRRSPARPSSPWWAPSRPWWCTKVHTYIHTYILRGFTCSLGREVLQGMSYKVAVYR